MRGAAVRAGDACLAVALFGLAVIEIWVEPVFQTGLPGPRAALTAAAALATLPVATRAARPVAATTAVVLGLLTVGVIGEVQQAGLELFLALALVLWSLATRTRGVTATRSLLAVLAGAAVYQGITFAPTDVAVDVIVPVIFLLAVWTAGAEVRRLRDRTNELREQAAALHQQQEAERLAAVQDERDRIARELHDVVASALTIIGVQAAAASTAAAATDEAVGPALMTIERTARGAVLEMQQMLQVLRDGADPDRSGPTFETLSGLVADSGLEVELRAPHDLDTISPAMQLTVLRIVQEAVTNVRKHANTQRCRVEVVVGADEVAVVVSDEGVGAGSGWVEGHGLIGMAERVRLAGGRLSAAGRAEGGFEVHARLPRTA